jgi:hypothetical protein
VGENFESYQTLSSSQNYRVQHIEAVDRRLGPHQARFWLDGVEKPSPAMFEAVIWTLQTKIEYTLSYFLFSHNKKIATLCLPSKHASGSGTV